VETQTIALTEEKYK